MLAVTGASGFLGRHVVAQAVGQGWSVMAVSRSSGLAGPSGVKVVVVDDYADFKPDVAETVLIHLAEPAVVGAAEAAGEAFSAQISQTLAQLLERGFAHIVYASSACVYGDHCPQPRRVSDPLSRPASVYGRAKLACEQLLSQRDGAVARLANVYGPGMATDGVVAQILAQIPATGPLWVRDAAPVRDFLWVGDAVAALLVLASCRRPGVYNVGTGVGTAIGALAGVALAVAGQADRAVCSRKPAGRPSHCVLDVRQTARTLGWCAQTPVAAGLKQLLQGHS
jgi:UDP-glucose 4-epimerase